MMMGSREEQELKNWANGIMSRSPWFRGLRRSDIRVAEPDLPPVRDWNSGVYSGKRGGRVSEPGNKVGSYFGKCKLDFQEQRADRESTSTAT